MGILRAPAVPLITVDPAFSIWSFADELYQDTTRHWTGSRQNMLGLVTIDGEPYRFMGKLQSDGVYEREPRTIRQKDVSITPLQTMYRFENEQIALELTFMTPLLLDDLKLCSRPVSYISYAIRPRDGKPHDISVYLFVNSEAAVNTNDQTVSVHKYQNGICCGRGEQGVLAVSGDDRRIDWGWLHLFANSHTPLITNIRDLQQRFINVQTYRGAELMPPDEFAVQDGFVSIGLTKSYTLTEEGVSDFVCIAYDDIHSIEYFGKPIDAYYKKDGDSFADVCRMALTEYGQIQNRVDVFEADLLARANQLGSKYADIISLAYRQAIAAHKLTWDGEEIQFFSKECYSNGCIATVDVTYPSIPLFLLYNPDLVCGMLNPIFKYASSGAWPFPYAPHDVGQYPLANGQVYGLDRSTDTLQPDKQMPVEECGNILICVAAVCKAKGEYTYARKHRCLLQQWADYLVQNGLNPQNQLCTDDFAGHLAHNCNLSAKAIVGIACFGMLLEGMGEPGAKYAETAKRYAKAWKEKAFDQDHYRLAFDREGTWSVKYNLVWDKLFGLNLFDGDVFATELDYYKKQIKQFGLPLDCRSDYTKTDWQMWATRLIDDRAFTNKIIETMWDMLNQTESRAPFTDWYFCSTAKQRGFQNRTVQGGLFINLLEF